MKTNSINFKGLMQIGKRYINTKQIKEIRGSSGEIHTKIIYIDGKSEKIKAYAENLAKAFNEAEKTGKTVKVDCWG